MYYLKSLKFWISISKVLTQNVKHLPKLKGKIGARKNYPTMTTYDPHKKNIGLKNPGCCLRLILRHTYFFQFLGRWTLLSLDLGPKGVSNL